jgi:uncharacterized protein
MLCGGLAGYITLDLNMLLRYVRRFSFLLLCAFTAPVVNAASFDCAKAVSPVERMICSDRLLSRLDDALAENYRNMLSADFGGSKADLRGSQREWLAQRNKCKDSACLVGLYRLRVDETCEYGVVSGVHPGCTPSEDIK